MKDSAVSVAEEEPTSHPHSMYSPAKFIQGKLTFQRAHLFLVVKCVQFYHTQAKHMVEQCDICTLAHSGQSRGRVFNKGLLVWEPYTTASLQ